MKPKEILDKIANMLAGSPVAIVLRTAEGAELTIDSEADADLVGKAAMFNGAPAEGAYKLEDGRTIVCAGGLVTEVNAPAPPAEAPPAEESVEALKAKIAALEAQAAQRAAQAKEEEINAKKAEEASVVEAQMKALESEIKKLKSKTVGDELPVKKVAPTGPSMMTPKAMVRSSDPKGIELAKMFIINNPSLKWLENYYPEGYFNSYMRRDLNGPVMASILETNFNYTWNGIITDQIFFKPTLDSPALSDIFTIDQGISWQKKYNLLGQLEKILKPYTGCASDPNNNINNITNTTLQTKEFRMYEGWCKDDFTDYLTGQYNYLAQEWLKTGEASFDPAGTPIDRIIMDQLLDALRRDVFRRVSFGAGNSSDVDYNQIDGLWDRLIDSSGASNYCVVRAGSALGTGTLAAGAALTALEAVYAGSNLLLKQMIRKAGFFVTRSVWDNYYNSLIGTGAVTEQAFENLQKGLTTLTYKGIPVRPVDIWDYFLAESDNPLTATTRHLILLTVKENHILGVESGADLNKIDSWFEKKDDKRYYRADMKFGYQYLHCDLQTIAY